MLAALKRVQYYEIKAYSGHFYTPKSGKAAFCGTLSGRYVLKDPCFFDMKPLHVFLPIYRFDALWGCWISSDLFSPWHRSKLFCFGAVHLA